MLDARQCIPPCPEPGTCQKKKNPQGLAGPATELSPATAPVSEQRPWEQQTQVSLTTRSLLQREERYEHTAWDIKDSRESAGREHVSPGHRRARDKAVFPTQPQSCQPGHPSGSAAVPLPARAAGPGEGWRGRYSLLLHLTPSAQGLSRLIRTVRVGVIHAEVAPVREGL